VISFIEARHDAVERAKSLLLKYAGALRHGTSVQVEVVEEIGQPQRFVMLETAPRLDDLAHSETAAQPIMDSLIAALLAPLDRRVNRDFAAGPPSSAGNSTRFYVIAHLDLVAPNQAQGEQMLRELVAAERQSPGNARATAWQQSEHPNHFNLVSAWKSAAEFNTFADGTAGRAFRSGIAGLTGSPYDERLYRRID
jgi:quinol monooxygenase YgiN